MQAFVPVIVRLGICTATGYATRAGKNALPI